MKKIMFDDKYGLTLAVLLCSKTMTRRKIRFSPNDLTIWERMTPSERKAMEPIIIARYSRYQVGEEVAVAQSYESIYGNGDIYHFKGEPGWSNKMFVKASFMPHHIRITGIKIQRLQEISEADCLKEDIIPIYSNVIAKREGIPVVYGFCGWKYTYVSAVRAFETLIDNMMGKGTWESNPWVFAYSFQRIS